MRPFWLVTLVVLVAGCAREAGSGACGPGRACPVSCSTAAGCGDGKVCDVGLCANPAPTTAVYAACALDVDCPDGDHCALGACAHECLADRDCDGGLVCSSRGRCIAAAEVDAPPPLALPAAPEAPVEAAALGVSAGALDLGRAGTEAELVITNTRGAPLPFRIVSDRPWISAEPSSGEVSGLPQAIRVRVDRAAAGAETRGVLTVNSTAGRATVQVAIDRDVSGYYAGTVDITQPFAFATSSLRLSLFESQDGATVAGRVDPVGSLLYPVRAGVSGTVSGDEVTLSFVVAGAKGSAANPHYPRPIRRTITLSGLVTGSGTIEGTVSEVIAGPVDGRDVTVRGTFRLERMAAADPGAADPVPDLPPTPVAAPWSDPAYTTCRTSCPLGASCATPLAAAYAYLQQAASFYRAFQDAADAAATSPFDVVSTNCGGTGCVNVGALRCAQYHFATALDAPDTAAAAAVGMLDTLEVLADYAILFGNQKVVDASEAWKNGAQTLADEIPSINEAASYFTAGSHTDATLPQALLDPYFLGLAMTRIDGATLASASSTIPNLLGDYASARRPFEYLRRQALAIGGALRARLEAADRQHRIGDAGAARQSALRGAMQAYLDLAMLAPLVERAGLAPEAFVETGPILRDFEHLAHRFEAVNGGRNPAGYIDGFVPLLMKTNDSRTNYQQIYAAAQEFHDRVARPEEELARATLREYEKDGAALLDQLQRQRTELQAQILELCGAVDFSTKPLDLSACGGPGSELARSMGEVHAAALRVQAARLKITNLHEEIRIEEQRAREVSKIHDNYAKLILKNGRQIRALDQAGSWTDRVGSFVLENSDTLLALPPGLPALSALKKFAVGGIFGGAKARMEQRRAELLATQEAQAQFDQAQIELVNSAAKVKTLLLEMGALSIDVELALESAGQAADVALGLVRKAHRLEAEYDRLATSGSANVHRLLQFRLYADANALHAQESFRTYMQWAFLATRAFEYEMNLSYAYRDELWKARSAAEVARYLGYLNLGYQGSTLSPQTNVDVISVRDDLLGLWEPIEDGVTGFTYDARERFRRFVMDPANRDADGNLRITFVTHRPGTPLFSQAVCNDRVRSVRVNLVGDALGAGVTYAYVSLAQGGINYQRECGGARALVPYDLSGDPRETSGPGVSGVSSGYSRPRIARVQAGINAPSNASALPANTDLAARGLLGGPWTLVIDQRAEVEPQNAALDLSGLDDIELVIEHEASTLQ